MISRSLLQRRPIAMLQFAFLGILLLFLAPEIIDASSAGHGTRRRGGGVRGGIGIGIGIRLLPRILKPKVDRELNQMERELDRTEAEMDAAFEDDEEEQPRRQPQQKRQVAAKKSAPVPPGKVSKPSVQYLSQLAMSIDPTLVTLAMTDPALALKFFQDMAANARKRGDSFAEKEALTSLGHVYFLIGWLSNSVGQYQLAIAINKRLGDAQGLAVSLRNLSAALTAGGDFKEAEAYGKESLQLFSDTEDTVGKQMVLNNLGVIASKRGGFKRAADLFSAAMQASEDDRDSGLLTFLNAGDLYTSWRVYGRALQDYEKAFNEAIALVDLPKAADILIRISQVYRDQGEYAKALEQSQTALALLTRIGAPSDRVKKWIGDLYLDRGSVTEAEPYVKDAGYYSSLGRMYLIKSQLDPAKQQYEKLLKESTQAGNLGGQFTAYTGLGNVFERLKKYSQARIYYTKAMKITDQIRSTLLPSQRKNFSAVTVNGFLRSEPARGLVRIALKQNRGTQSIDPAEMTRAQDFADKLAQTPDVHRFDVPGDVLEKEADLNNRIASLKAALPILSKKEDSKRFSAITKEIKQAESARNKLVQQLRTKYPNYASVKYPKPVSLNTARIKPDEYVVLFDVLGDGVGIRLIKGRRVVKSAYTEWNVNEREQEIQAFRSSFEKVELKKFDPALAAKLYDRLLSGVMEDIPQGAPLTILPDGLLALLPFEALVTGGTARWQSGEWGDYPTGLTYVGDRNPIVYYQSLTAMTLTRARAEKEQKGDRMLVMADPVFSMLDARAQDDGAFSKVATAGSRDSMSLMAAIEEETGGLFKLPRLKETEELTENLRGLYGANSDIYTGLKSSKATFMSTVAPQLTNYRSIVFATHGFAGNSIPGIMEPALALTMVPPGTDGFLTMSEVAGLKMNPDIAALTACKTGVGVKLACEGVMSMGRAFQSAGAKSVAMSLWSVSEKASVMLMEAFFKKLKEGQAKLDAWSAARQELRRAGLEHPFFWAAFILVGERQ